MNIIDSNLYLDSVYSNLKSLINNLCSNTNYSNGLLFQSINGIRINDLEGLENVTYLKVIIDDLQRIHNKININLIDNNLSLIEQNHSKGQINLLFLITLPQIIFKGKMSVNWILSNSLEEVPILNTSIFKIDDLFLYVINLQGLPEEKSHSVTFSNT